MTSESSAGSGPHPDVLAVATLAKLHGIRGEIKLRALRARAEAALGPAFDLRAFHNEVLVHGAVPLDVLDAAVDRWIAAQKKG